MWGPVTRVFRGLGHAIGAVATVALLSDHRTEGGPDQGAGERGAVIVVGYAAGAFGRACLEQGIVEARLRDTELLVINAVSEVRGQRLVDADEIAQVQARLTTAGIRFRIRQPIGATPAEELLNAMDSDDAELLVIGMRRRTQFGKLLLGSTSQYLLVSCHKPVLVVKPTDEHRRSAPLDRDDRRVEDLHQTGDEIEP